MLMADAPLMYGNYSSKMFPIIPDGEKTVGHALVARIKLILQKFIKKSKKF